MLALPGVVLPAKLAYEGLARALGEDVDLVSKELELYAGERPPPGYGIETELDGLLRAADEAGFERFHLVGYSGGGAVSLAAAAYRPQRLLSLTLMEPAWAGHQQLTQQEQALWLQVDRLHDLDSSDPELLSEFVAMQLRPGVEPPPPPPGPVPTWMAQRPAGIHALTGAFLREDLDLDRLRAFERPVLFVLGGLSNPDYWEPMRARLADVFPDFSSELYTGRHHFDPPHRAEPERLAESLRALWARAGTAVARSGA